MVQIGKIIHQQAQKQGISVKKLAAKLNISTPATYKILQREDMSIQRLLQFSSALNHNFFKYYLPAPKVSPEQYKALQNENQQLKQQIQILQRENNLLNDFVQLLKSNKYKD
ncbi:MAG: hypothetical protein R2764_19620 [Bacteroidales bacterium]